MQLCQYDGPYPPSLKELSTVYFIYFFALSLSWGCRMRKEKSAPSDLKKSLCRIWCIPLPSLQCPEALQSNSPVHPWEASNGDVQYCLSGSRCSATSSVRNLLLVYRQLYQFAFFIFRRWWERGWLTFLNNMGFFARLKNDNWQFCLTNQECS